MSPATSLLDSSRPHCRKYAAFCSSERSEAVDERDVIGATERPDQCSTIECGDVGDRDFLAAGFGVLLGAAFMIRT